MINNYPSEWEQWAECDTCHAQTPVFAVSANDNRLFDYMRDHKWKRYFPPGSKTHADERVMCGECRQADLADAKDGYPMSEHRSAASVCSRASGGMGGLGSMSETKDDLLYEAWGLISNAGDAPLTWRVNGETTHLSPQANEWVTAAERWRNKWHDTLVVKGMDHEIVVTLSERRGLAVQFRCNMDVDAPCRTRCPQHCESDCEHDKEPGHPCAYLPWMDGDMYGDYYVGPDVPAFASGPVEFVWNGDGYDWRYQDGWFEQ